MSDYSFTAYMDGTDFFVESRAGSSDPMRLYAFLPALKEACKSHIDSCGIVKVRITLERVIKRGRHMPEGQ